MNGSTIDIVPVAAGKAGKRDLKAFIDVAYRLNQSDPVWVAPLRSEMAELTDPAKNPFFGHATVQFFIAQRDGKVVGRISAHIDHLAEAQPVEQGMGPGTGNWGLLEAEDEAVAIALIGQAEQWLRDQGMHRVLAPLSMSVWEEPGLLVQGHDHSPSVMMGHDAPHYQGWIEGMDYNHAKSLYTYELDISTGFSPIIQRIVKSGERKENVRVREVDLNHFDRDAAIILNILNDAWSDNWGFVPFTDAEIAYVGKKMKPLVHPELIRIAELDGKPIAFMMTLPDFNEPLKKLNGRLFPFGWLTLLRWLRRPMARTMRVPLMGVLKEHQSSRLASQLAFMMISYIRVDATRKFGSTRGELGWVLEDNQGMIAIADAIESTVNREYVIYEKLL